MKYQIACVLAAAAIAASPAAAQEPPPLPDSVSAYVDSALVVMRSHVIGGDTVDWHAFRARVFERAAGSEIPLDTYRALRWALRSLNPHSFLQTGTERWRLEVERHPELAERGAPEESPILSPFSDRRRPEGRLFERAGATVGYVRVPGFGGGHLTEFADSIQMSVRDQEEAGACGWVVDLRGNGGGNMWPMLAGLGALVGEGRLGEFHTADGVSGVWFQEGGVTGIDPTDGGERVEVARVTEPFRLDRHPPVAVLFDRGTGSSGEAVAIAFIGRPATRSFGVTTYGYTTSNQGFRMPDGANIVLTVGVNADRDGRPYPTAVEPDERVEIRPDGTVPETAPHPDRDRQLRSALEWLLRRAECQAEASF